MAADISAQIGIDGEKQFKDSLKAVNSELKALDAEMKAAVAEFANMDDAEEKSIQKSQMLNEQIDKQKEKLGLLESQYEKEVEELDQLAEALERAKEEFGENSEEAGKAQNAYNKQAVECNKLRTEIANTTGKISEANNELNEMETAGDNAADGLEEVGNEASLIDDIFKGELSASFVIGAFNAIKDKAGELAGSLKNAFMSASLYGDQIDKQSQKIRVSAKEYQQLAFAAQRSGTSIDVMQTAMKALSGSDFGGTLPEAIEYVASLSEEYERANVAQNLFGKKAAMELMPMLNSGADGVREMFEQVEALGGIMSDEAVAASAAYQDSLTNLQYAFDGVKNQMMGEFLPDVTTVLDGIVEVLSGDMEKGKQMISEGFAGIQTKIVEFMKNIADHMPEMIEIGIKLLTALITGLMGCLPTLIAQAPAIVMALVNGIISMLPELAKAGAQMYHELDAELEKGVQKLKEIGRNMVEGLWNGIKERSTWLLSQVRSWCQSILNEVKSFFDINSPSRVMNKEVGMMLGRGMALGIENSTDYAVNAMKAMGQEVMNATPTITSQFAMQTASNEALASGLVNGLTGARGAEPVNLSVQLVLQDGRAIAETVFNDLLNVGKQRGVSLA